jgi:hypothetical protein
LRMAIGAVRPTGGRIEKRSIGLSRHSCRPTVARVRDRPAGVRKVRAPRET